MSTLAGMSILVRWIIFIVQFLILFAFEFFFARKTYLKLKWKKLKKNIIKNYIKFCIVAYTILDLIILFIPILIYSNETLLSYNKLFLWLLIISFLIVILLYIYDGKKEYKSEKYFLSSFLVTIVIYIIIATLVISFMVITFNQLNFSTTVSSQVNITEYTDVNKLIKCNNNKYILLFTENGNVKEEVISKDDIEVLEYSDSIDIKKYTTTSTLVNYELKDPQKTIERTYKYYIFIPQNIVIDVTDS